MDNQTPPPMDNQTPPPNPDEEWAKKLKLDYDPQRAKEAEQKAGEQMQAQPPVAPPPPVPPTQGFPSGAPVYPAYGSVNPGEQPEQMPPTYMLWSVLALIFCCLPTAVVAIIYSAQVSSKFYAKDYEGARRCSERAQMWIIASIVLGIITMAVYLPLSLLTQ